MKRKPKLALRIALGVVLYVLAVLLSASVVKA
ncbi:hypothetical protein GGQ74_002375 [Desulfobaculum xiamenense]|uniref:Uncharacterized protein n=1 Tax=Desulfobaculum xiamenense TaxID=995050 RepID=A0A846QQC6_9BACT|nr:hypothetical protein [Desulfobaculum xiamenense]